MSSVEQAGGHMQWPKNPRVFAMAIAMLLLAGQCAYAQANGPSLSAQRAVGGKDAVTAVAGESWLVHLNRSFSETSMGKTGHLGPPAPAPGEDAPRWQPASLSNCSVANRDPPRLRSLPLELPGMSRGVRAGCSSGNQLRHQSGAGDFRRAGDGTNEDRRHGHQPRGRDQACAAVQSGTVATTPQWRGEHAVVSPLE